MAQGQNTIIVRSHQVKTVRERVDSDGVITVNERVQKFRGKPTSVSLYVKLFKQANNKSILYSLSGCESAVFHFSVDQICDSSNEFWLERKTLLLISDRYKSKAIAYGAVTSLKKIGLLKQISSHRYMINPYYAAIGSDAEVKELRQKWDLMCGQETEVGSVSNGDKK